MAEKNRREFLANGGAAIGAGITLSPSWFRARQSRKIQLETDRAYDPSQIPPYSGKHQDIYDHINEHRDEHIGKIQDYLRQRSISAQNIGIRECAEMTASYLREIGASDAKLVPTRGHPVVWGSIDSGASKTIMNYGMYDVQPVNPEEWSSPPFEARLVDLPPFGKSIMARGALNTKGPLRAFLNACESIIAVRGKLPVNMLFGIEGEEEIGSLHYPDFIEEYREPISKADGVIFAQCMQDSRGKVTLWLGFKGIVYLELEASGERWGRGPQERGIHSMYKAVVDSPVWRLVRALGTLVDESNNQVTIEGYEDAIVAPPIEDQELVNRLVAEWDESVWKEELGVEHFIDDPDRKELILKYLYDTTFNLAGIWGGYTGPGPKTILPMRATAKIDSRLVPDQTPEKAVELVKKHLEAEGYPDIDVRVLQGYPGSKTSVKTPLIQSTLSVYKKYGVEPVIWPHVAGSAPFYVFSEWLKLPFSYMGIGHGHRQHAPDEYLVVDGNGVVADLMDAEKAWVDTLFALSES